MTIKSFHLWGPETVLETHWGGGLTGCEADNVRETANLSSIEFYRGKRLVQWRYTCFGAKI